MSTSKETLAGLMPATKQGWFTLALLNSNEIAAIERKLIDIAEKVESLRRHMLTLEAYTATNVAAELEGGKPKFSNETSRKAEIASRLEASEMYREAKRELSQAEHKQRLAQIDLGTASRLFSIAKRGLGE